MKKGKIILIVIPILMILYIIFLDFYKYYCLNLFFSNLDEIEEDIVSYKNSEVSKYINIEIEEPYMIYNKTAENQEIVGDELCNMTYKLRLSNRTNTAIYFDAKAFMAPELTKDIVMSQTLFSEQNEQILLEPGKGMNYSSGILLLHTDKMTEKQKELLDKLKYTLYFQVHINDNYYVFKYEKPTKLD